jgi:hypothetical protein
VRVSSTNAPVPVVSGDGKVGEFKRQLRKIFGADFFFLSFSVPVCKLVVSKILRSL